MKTVTVYRIISTKLQRMRNLYSRLHTTSLLAVPLSMSKLLDREAVSTRMGPFKLLQPISALWSVHSTRYWKGFGDLGHRWSNNITCFSVVPSIDSKRGRQTRPPGGGYSLPATSGAEEQTTFKFTQSPLFSNISQTNISLYSKQTSVSACVKCNRLQKTAGTVNTGMWRVAFIISAPFFVSREASLTIIVIEWQMP